MRRRWVLVAVAAVAAIALVVTAAVLVTRARGSRGGAAPAPVPRYDPPHRFDLDGAVNLPREADGDPPPVGLHEFTAFVALPGRLQVIDTRTGAVRAEARPGSGGEVASGAAPHAPARGRLGEREVVAAAFGVSVPGHGTTVGHDAVDLVVLDRDSLERLPGARVDLPPMLGDAGRLRAAWILDGPTEVATVVAEVGPDREPTTYAVDLRTGAVRWRAVGFAAAYAAKDLLIGIQQGPEGSRARAVAAAGGRPVWTVGEDGEDGERVNVARGGPALVAVVSLGVGTGRRSLAFHDVGNGRPQGRRAVPGGVTCRFDERLTTVCWNADAAQPWAAGFDAVTGRSLWELPDAAAGRVAPRVTAVWHGAVYGTTENGPVVLRAPTGQDWTGPSPQVAPDVVNDVVGVVGATPDRPRPKIYRAVG